MRRIIVTVIICLAIAIFGIQTGNAAPEPVKNCSGDPMLIDFGDIIDCGVNISDTRNFIFYANNGDKVRLTMNDLTSGNPRPYLYLYDPNTKLIGYFSPQDSGSFKDFNLQLTGEYVVVVFEYGNDEAVDFRIALQGIIPSAPEARILKLDSHLDGDINPFTDTDVFIFDGTAGDKIRLTMTDLTSGSPRPYLYLYDPNGKLLGYFSPQDSGSFKDFNLQLTGEYVVVVFEYGNDEAVDFRIALQGIIPYPVNSLTLCHNIQIDDGIDPDVDSDVFIFDGTAGDKIRLTMTDLTSGSPRPYLYLYDPNGKLLGYFSPQDSGSFKDFNLQVTGKYRVVVFEYGNDEKVNYKIGFTCILGDCFDGCSPFADVPTNYWAYEEIMAIYDAGITTGCSTNPLKYCPLRDVNRAAMAIFLERCINDGNYTPPPATGDIFDDVPVDFWAADWIEQLYNDGVTTGCTQTPMNYCPDRAVNRAAMAVFLLRSEHGSNYTPPLAKGIFDDVPITHWAADWIEQLYNEGITTGCKTNPLSYCPDRAVRRDAMAVFLERTCGL